MVERGQILRELRPFAGSPGPDRLVVTSFTAVSEHAFDKPLSLSQARCHTSGKFYPVEKLKKVKAAGIFWPRGLGWWSTKKHPGAPAERALSFVPDGTRSRRRTNPTDKSVCYFRLSLRDNGLVTSVNRFHASNPSGIVGRVRSRTVPGCGGDRATRV
jgi:hypothetical protein